MSGLKISIDVTGGQAKVKRLLQAIERKTLLDVIGMRFLSWIDESFRTRGRGKWAPLSSLTLQLRKNGGDVPLQDTGKYKQSFVPAKSDGRTFVEVGSNRKTPSGILLAEIHEAGTAPFTITARNAKILAARSNSGAWIFFGKIINHPGIPARPVLPTQAEAEKAVQETINAMLARIIGRESARGGA